MRKTFLFPDLPTTTRVDSPGSRETSALLRMSGGNTGNLVFRHAIASLVDVNLIPCHWAEAIKVAKEREIDGVILAGANFLHSSQSFSNDKRAASLREIGLPVLCIGLGCQHPTTEFRKLNFPADTIELLATFRDLDATLCLRDEMTLKQCEHYGIKKLFLTGCPSNFINRDNDFHKKLDSRWEKNNFDRVTLNQGYLTKESIKHDRHLLGLIQNREGKFIVQTNEGGLIALALGRTSEVSDAQRRASDKAYGVSRFPWSRRRFSPRLLGTYFDVTKWMEDVGSEDLVVGSRIHGAMVAMQSATPTVLSVIDSRTEGLAATMGIPFVSGNTWRSWKGTPSPSQIIDSASPDLKIYGEKRQELAAALLGAFRQSGVECQGDFEQLALR